MDASMAKDAADPAESDGGGDVDVRSSNGLRRPSEAEDADSSFAAAPPPCAVHLDAPLLAVVLLIACSVSYLAGEVFRLQMPGHPLTMFASAVGSSLAPPLSDLKMTSEGGNGASEDAVNRSAALATGRTGTHTIPRRKRDAVGTGSGSLGTKREKQLPRPRLQRGKAMPETRYTARVYLDEEGRSSGDGGGGRGRKSMSGRTAVRSSFDRHIEAEVCEGDGECSAAEAEVETGGNVDSGKARNESTGGGSAEEEKEEEYLPSGQHLLVDIKNVDGTFLNSEERLAEAMVEVVNESHLTLLSYHCHSLVPSGVSCVGVLLESHISFHTWPMEGIITVDLFTCGPNPLMSVVPVIERLFAVPQLHAGTYQPLEGNGSALADGDSTYVHREEDYVDPPRMLWSHILRGFRHPLENGRHRILEKDVTRLVLSRLGLDHKAEIVNKQTDYQHIGIYDVVDPALSSLRSYERSIQPEWADTYEGRHPELLRPNRMVFLDGVIQSTSRGEAAYHEALVHPGMFAHPDPRRAAIIGGGEGATLREVLKHRTIEHVKMIEIDKDMVDVSREYLPEWSDCSDLVGSRESCFDDPRAELLCEDALPWFMDRFQYPVCDCAGKGRKKLKEAERRYCECDNDNGSDRVGKDEAKEEEDEDSSDDDEEKEGKQEDKAEWGPKSTLIGQEEKFDVIIVDALDPQDRVQFADALYNDEVFLESLYGALTERGVLVMQLGMSPRSVDPAEEVSFNENRDMVLWMIEDMGFESMHVYEEAHCGFVGYTAWSFLVACKSYDCRFNWYAHEAQRAVEIHDRIARTWSGAPALKHFDGATMAGYQVPPKAWESVFCRSHPPPAECSWYRGLDQDVANYPAENFEVRASSIGNSAGRGTFAAVDVPEGSYIMCEQTPAKVHFGPRTTYLMEGYYENVEEAEDLGDVLRYMYGYGFQQRTVANYEYYVDSGFLTFINHGCNGTNNMGAAFRIEDKYSRYRNEMHIDPTVDGIVYPYSGSTTFNPVHDRHLPDIAAGGDIALRDIKAGEELFQNYLFFITEEDYWVEEVRELQAQCRGEVLGSIKAEEEAWSEELLKMKEQEEKEEEEEGEKEEEEKD